MNPSRPGRRLALLAPLALATAVLAAGPAEAQKAGELRIALIASKSGPLEAYARQTLVGFNMGLDYATGGSRTVAGRTLVVIEKDDQGKPELGRALLAQAYAEDKADIAVGPTASPVALAMLPVAEEYRKILIVEPAVADSITGERWNPYIFRTGRNSSQDAIANAAALDKVGNTIVTLAQDNAFGRDGVKAFQEALKKARLVHEEYLPPAATDCTAALQHIVDKLKDLPGRKIVWVLWAGANAPFNRFAELELQKRHDIELATGGNILSEMGAYKQFPGLEGALYYYFGIPKNPVNEWLVANHYRLYKQPPDFFTAGGMSAAIAVVEALRKTRGDARAARLIPAMEGMSFQTPKGRMTFRKEDHQALQDMYHFKIRVDPAFPWGVPELEREIKAEEMQVPIRNDR